MPGLKLGDCEGERNRHSPRSRGPFDSAFIHSFTHSTNTLGALPVYEPVTGCWGSSAEPTVHQGAGHQARWGGRLMHDVMRALTK